MPRPSCSVGSRHACRGGFRIGCSWSGRSSHAACRAAVLAAVVLVVSLSVSSESAGQSSRPRGLFVRVFDESNGIPVEGAEVFLPATKRRGITDSVGMARFDVVGPGNLRIEARHDGYFELVTDFYVAGGDSIAPFLGLTRRAQALPTVNVSAEPVPFRLQGFETRRKAGRGQFLTPEQLRELWDRRVLEVIRTRFRGIDIVYSTDRTSSKIVSKQGQTILRNPRRNQYCELLVFSDGMYVPDAEFATWRASEFIAIEFYSAATVPPEFKRSGAQCGALLLWSK